MIDDDRPPGPTTAKAVIGGVDVGVMLRPSSEPPPRMRAVAPRAAAVLPVVASLVVVLMSPPRCPLLFSCADALVAPPLPASMYGRGRDCRLVLGGGGRVVRLVPRSSTPSLTTPLGPFGLTTIPTPNSSSRFGDDSSRRSRRRGGGGGGGATVRCRAEEEEAGGAGREAVGEDEKIERDDDANDDDDGIMDRALERFAALTPEEWSADDEAAAESNMTDLRDVLQSREQEDEDDDDGDEDEGMNLYRAVFRELEEAIPASSPSSSAAASKAGRSTGPSSSSSSSSSSPPPREEEEDDDDPRRPALLLPETNPRADPDAFSLSSVSYSTVLRGISSLYPPVDLSHRNAASRTSPDGYWSYVERGLDPPRHLTYGEFDFHFFAELLDRARYHYAGGGGGAAKDGEDIIDDSDSDSDSDSSSLSSSSASTSTSTSPLNWDGMVFADIGSGTGRLVLSAAALHPGMRLCRGLELLPGIHRLAEDNLERCRVVPATEIDDGRGEDEGEGEGEDLAQSQGRRSAPSSLGIRSAWGTTTTTISGGTRAASDDDDEDWLQSFAGNLLGIEEEEEEEDDDVNDDDDDEWRSADDWGSQFAGDPAASSPSLTKGRDEPIESVNNEDEDIDDDDDDDDEEDEDEWRSPDTWGSGGGGGNGAYVGGVSSGLPTFDFSPPSSSSAFPPPPPPPDASIDNDGAIVAEEEGDRGEEGKAEEEEEEEEETPAHYALRCPPPSTGDDRGDDECGEMMEGDDANLPLAPVNFECGSFSDPYVHLGDVDVAFVFSSCMGRNLLEELSRATGRHLKTGAIVVTTEFPLRPLEGTIGPSSSSSPGEEKEDEGEGEDERRRRRRSDDDDDRPSLPSGPYKLELLEEVQGWCWLTGGESTAYVHRVVESLWADDGTGTGRGKRYERPRPTCAAMAREALGMRRRGGDDGDGDDDDDDDDKVKEEEEGGFGSGSGHGREAEEREFLRRVRNDMAFHGLPEEWWPAD